MPIVQCPQKEIGSRFARQINLVVHAMNGLLPDAGGVNDQDAWFVNLWSRFRADVNLCEREKQKQK